MTASALIVRKVQQDSFADILNFMNSKGKNICEAPPLIYKYNLTLDGNGILRVKSKFGRFSDSNLPILLPNNSPVTDKLILDVHKLLMHSGVYGVLAQLRKKYFLIHPLSSVRRALRGCVPCKKLNTRSVKLSQNSYRMFRASPKSIPFHSIFLDHMGPFTVKTGETKKKYYILILTCLWSRAVNMVPCPDLSVPTFLKTFQRHVFDYGLPGNITSDLGTSLVAGANIIKSHLASLPMRNYLAEYGIKNFTFDHYDKGNSELGSLVEVVVKLASSRSDC